MFARGGDGNQNDNDPELSNDEMSSSVKEYSKFEPFDHDIRISVILQVIS